MRIIYLDFNYEETFYDFRRMNLNQEIVVVNPAGDFFSLPETVQDMAMVQMMLFESSRFFVFYNGKNRLRNMPANVCLVCIGTTALRCASKFDGVKMLQLDGENLCVPSEDVMDDVVWVDFDTTNGSDICNLPFVADTLNNEGIDVTFNFFNPKDIPPYLVSYEVFPDEMLYWGYDEFTPSMGNCMAAIEDRNARREFIHSIPRFCIHYTPSTDGAYQMIVPADVDGVIMLVYAKFLKKDGKFVRYIGRLDGEVFEMGSNISRYLGAIAANPVIEKPSKPKGEDMTHVVARMYGGMLKVRCN